MNMQLRMKIVDAHSGWLLDVSVIEGESAVVLSRVVIDRGVEGSAEQPAAGRW